MKNSIFKIICVTVFSFVTINLFSQTADSASQNFEEAEIRKTVETLPEPIGGEQAFLQAIAFNLKYDRAEVPSEFTVYLSFIIDTEGEISNITVIKGAGSKLSTAAIASLKATKVKWHPATINGKPIETTYYLPITFLPKQ